MDIFHNSHWLQFLPFCCTPPNESESMNSLTGCSSIMKTEWGNLYTLTFHTKQLWGKYKNDMIQISLHIIVYEVEYCPYRQSHQSGNVLEHYWCKVMITVVINKSFKLIQYIYMQYTDLTCFTNTTSWFSCSVSYPTTIATKTNEHGIALFMSFQHWQNTTAITKTKWQWK